MEQLLPSIILAVLICGTVFFIPFALHTAKKERKKAELELESIKAPIEQEFFVRVSDMRCTVNRSNSAKNPVAQKEFYVLFDILNDEQSDPCDQMTLILDEDTYKSLEIGMTGYIALSGDAFLGFVPEGENGVR